MTTKRFKRTAEGLYIRSNPSKIRYYGMIKNRTVVFPKKWLKRRYEIHQERYVKMFLRLIPKLNFNHSSKDRIKILDVGCGEGIILKALKTIEATTNYKFDLYGIDIDPISIKRIKVKSHLSVGSATKLPYQKNYFDFITSSHVLEHLKLIELKVSLKEIYKVLKPKGIFLAETPNPDSLLAKTMGNDWWMFVEETHMTLMSPQRLNTLLRGASFKNITSTSSLEIDEQMDEIREIYQRSHNPYLKFVKNLLKPIRHRLLRHYLQLSKMGSITTAIATK